MGKLFNATQIQSIISRAEQNMVQYEFRCADCGKVLGYLANLKNLNSKITTLDSTKIYGINNYILCPKCKNMRKSQKNLSHKCITFSRNKTTCDICGAELEG